MAATLRLHEGYARPIHETVVDGVQTFWADDDEPFEAKLLFRVGRADESLLTSGVSHLIEHLALPQHDRHLSYVNGTTEPLLTYFEGAGERREVLDFLQEVSANLGKLPLDRLTREMRILREEAADFSPTISSRLAWQRFGARHRGLYDEPEFGLYRLSAGQVTRWARRFFTSGNAVLWMTGRPPRNFVLGLPHGPPRSPPHPPPPTWHLPAWSTGSIGIIGWSTIARRTAAARLGLRLAQERITERLRYALGISYVAWLDWYLLGRGLSEAVVSAGVLGGYEQMAADEIVESLEVLVGDGPSATDLRWVKREAAFRTTRPGELRTWLDIIATDHLLEAKTRSTSAWLTEVNGLTRTDVRAAFEEMLAISILRTPAEVDLPDSRYVAAPVWAGERPVVGRRFNEPADDKGEADQLIVGDDGVSYVDEDGAGTILFSEAAGLVRREGLPSDLYRLDGKYIDLDNIVEWPRGKAALRAVSEVTPRRLIIDVP